MFLNLLFYDVTFESNLNFIMQADNSINPSILTVLEIDTKKEKEMIINYIHENAALILTATKDRIKCTSFIYDKCSYSGKRILPAMDQTSNQLLLKKVVSTTCSRIIQQ